MSFVSKILGSPKYPYYFLRAKDAEGRECYHIVKSSPQNIQRLEEDSGRGVVDISAYGTVLFSDFGEYPAPYAQDFLKKKHDMDWADFGVETPDPFDDPEFQ